jgi:simple sugar transport system ATP-binding protein
MNPNPPLAVRMASITKKYPSVVANDGASLEVRAGEVHALVGENGAGKSTLMKILYGMTPPDEGRIEVLGKPLSRHNPAGAIAAGLGMVFQHFMLVPPLSVAENVVLGVEPRRGLAFDRARAIAEVDELSRRFGLPIDPQRPIESCSVGLQQRVEILKVLHRGAEVIVLDEPTAVLTPQEVDELIAVVRRLAANGKTIILITHKLREVMAAADRITVMRHGKTIETLETARTNPGEIAEKMIGRALETVARPPGSVAGRTAEPVLEIRGLSARSVRETPALCGVDLAIASGEILGVAGIEGNGQSELVECIAGLRKADAGTLRLLGHDLAPLSVRARADLGISHVPEDRHRRGIVLDMSVEENAVLGLQHQPGLGGRFTLSVAAMRERATKLIRGSDVRPTNPAIPIRALSGGNQQKVVFGRELSRDPKLLLACHPTRGLDVSASEFVARAMLAERARGAAVLFVSAELPELMAISDRVVVMFGGAIVGEVDPALVDERRLGLLMAGHP